MSVQIELISEHVKEAINGAGQPGFLQLCRINPLDDKSVVPSRFEIGDVEHMVQTATGDAAASRSSRPGSSSAPAGCGTQTSCSPRSLHPRHRLNLSLKINLNPRD